MNKTIALVLSFALLSSNFGATAAYARVSGINNYGLEAEYKNYIEKLDEFKDLQKEFAKNLEDNKDPCIVSPSTLIGGGVGVLYAIILIADATSYVEVIGAVTVLGGVGAFAGFIIGQLAVSDSSPVTWDRLHSNFMQTYNKANDVKFKNLPYKKQQEIARETKLAKKIIKEVSDNPHKIYELSSEDYEVASLYAPEITQRVNAVLDYKLLTVKFIDNKEIQEIASQFQAKVKAKHPHKFFRLEKAVKNRDQDTVEELVKQLNMEGEKILYNDAIEMLAQARKAVKQEYRNRFKNAFGDEALNKLRNSPLGAALKALKALE